MNKRLTQLGKRLLLLAIALLLTMGLFTAAYRFDNKYTRRTVQPINGILFYTPKQANPVYLIHGWEYYHGRLLTPEDFADNLPIPDNHVYIGQYSGMEAGNPEASPHGSATYRLILSLPETPAFYTLELPEIYSAYRLYIGSRLMASQGNPEQEHYIPSITSGSVTFEAAGDVQLILAVSDWSHLYSGMVYPPAFGTPDAVGSLLIQRFAVSLTATVLAAVLGFFQLALAVILKNRRSLLSGLICMAFAGSAITPAFHQLVTTGIVPWYNLEIFCRYAIYGLSLLLVLDLCGRQSRALKAASYAAALFPFLALAVSLLAPGLSYRQMLLFSSAAGVYKVICALWLLGTAFFSRTEQEPEGDRTILLVGICIFASSLAADRLYPAFEPIRFGWFSEIAGFLFVLLLSFLLLRDSARFYKRQFILLQEKQYMESQIQMQKKHYSELASQIEKIRTLRHDIRHHFTQLSVLLKDGNGEAAAQYLNKLTESNLTASPLSFCNDYYVDVLLRYYYSQAEELQVPMSIHAALPEHLGIPEEDLCVVLGNLLENALEASLSVPDNHRRISVSMTYCDAVMAIEIQNTYTGELVSNGRGFLSTKQSAQESEWHGIGISSIRSIAERYDGEVWIQTDAGNGITRRFTVHVLLIAGTKNSE